MRHLLQTDVLPIFTTSNNILFHFNFTLPNCISTYPYRHKISSMLTLIDDSDAWRVPFLLFHRLTLGQMESKADRQVYKAAVQFRIDSATIVHNVAIFHGSEYQHFSSILFSFQINFLILQLQLIVLLPTMPDLCILTAFTN